MASLNDATKGKCDSTARLVDNIDPGDLHQHSLIGEGSSNYRPAAMPRPAQPYQNGLYHQNAYQMQSGNANYEENNNMDENCNDEAYEQYPNYHHQHYLAQQALHSQQQTNSHNTPSNQSHHADSSSNSIGASHLLHNSHTLMSDTRASDSNVHSRATAGSGRSSDSPSLVQSVRPRTTVAAPRRRMSLTPATNNQSLAASPYQDDSYSSWNSSQQHTPSSHSSNGQGTPDQCDASLPGLRQRSHSFRLQRRNSSYDSGMNELHEQGFLGSQLESSGRLPPLPPRSSYCAGPLPPLSNDGGAFALEPRVSTETEREAELLLYNFTQEELRREQLKLPSYLTDQLRLQQCHILQAGTELRHLADAFANTPARAQVRSMAEGVMFSALTWDNFASLCMQLFSGPQGITSERIVALFTFIADVAKNEIRRGAESCIRQLMTWSLRFIFEKVCQWVQRAGGWGRVLHQGLDVVYKMAMTAAAMAAAVAMGVYVFRTLKHT